ncbi:amidase [Marinomonas balearica]|uniref:Asp-tRNA(Asn)/Glu-tRNA(Gln) amidotransferase A subunit family amidase n=1 Tax=Marinomonas balearica TaxID=491947 RepID=A0A4R6M2L1_9GAMM|nr:amidase [Marinomonas balearica]TDO95491.1 Asp-tRNA(Asn)/Glu-tRNA(Gln) amidotransferase A subunit family amidase [Marinomonas balearica]
MTLPLKPNTLSLSQMCRSIEKGEHTAEAIINACFDQIEAREPDVRAWQYQLDREAYLKQYRDNQSFYESSLLKGLPVGIKDIIDTKDMPTEMGSPIHKGRQPIDDATCVALIRQAGGIVLGKTVTTEFAYFKPGKTSNPKDLARTPGGSSSGSAAAVADTMVPVALGSQTAASVIRPAAYCGSIGYVGSRGEYSLRGAQPLAQSLDSLGLFSRHVEDIQLLRSILLRQSLSDAPNESVKPLRVLLCQGALIGDASVEMAQALSTLSDRLLNQGVDVVDLEAGDELLEMVDHHGHIMAWEVCRNLALESNSPEMLSDPLSDLMEQGKTMKRARYLSSLKAAEETDKWLWSLCDEVDVVLTPAAADIAPLGHDKTGSPHMSRPWQAMGLPVITLPGMQNSAGLPLGVQLIARHRDDDRLLQIAKWFETVLA